MVLLSGSVISSVHIKGQYKLYIAQLISLSAKHERDGMSLVLTIITWNSLEGGKEFESWIMIDRLIHSQNLAPGANM